MQSLIEPDIHMEIKMDGTIRQIIQSKENYYQLSSIFRIALARGSYMFSYQGPVRDYTDCPCALMMPYNSESLEQLRIIQAILKQKKFMRSFISIDHFTNASYPGPKKQGEYYAYQFPQLPDYLFLSDFVPFLKYPDRQQPLEVIKQIVLENLVYFEDLMEKKDYVNIYIPAQLNIFLKTFLLDFILYTPKHINSIYVMQGDHFVLIPNNNLEFLNFSADPSDTQILKRKL